MFLFRSVCVFFPAKNSRNVIFLLPLRSHRVGNLFRLFPRWDVVKSRHNQTQSWRRRPKTHKNVRCPLCKQNCCYKKSVRFSRANWGRPFLAEAVDLATVCKAGCNWGKATFLQTSFTLQVQPCNRCEIHVGEETALFANFCVVLFGEWQLRFRNVLKRFLQFPVRCKVSLVAWTKVFVETEKTGNAIFSGCNGRQLQF